MLFSSVPSLLSLRLCLLKGESLKCSKTTAERLPWPVQLQHLCATAGVPPELLFCRGWLPVHCTGELRGSICLPGHGQQCRSPSPTNTKPGRVQEGEELIAAGTRAISSRRWAPRSGCTGAPAAAASSACSAWLDQKPWRKLGQTPPASEDRWLSPPACTPWWSAPVRDTPPCEEGQQLWKSVFSDKKRQEKGWSS